MTTTANVNAVLLLLATVLSLSRSLDDETSVEVPMCSQNNAVTSRNVVIRYTHKVMTYPSMRTWRAPESNLLMSKQILRDENHQQELDKSRRYNGISINKTSVIESSRIAVFKVMNIISSTSRTTSSRSNYFLKEVFSTPVFQNEGSFASNTMKRLGYYRTTFRERATKPRECRCVISATDPVNSFMVVNVQFVKPELADTKIRDSIEDPTDDPQAQSEGVTSQPIVCPKLYLVYDERTRQELMCLGMNKGHVTVYRLPRLRLKTLALDLVMADGGNDVNYAGVVVNVTSVGVGSLRVNCNPHHPQSNTILTSSNIPAINTSGSTGRVHPQQTTPAVTLANTGRPDVNNNPSGASSGETANDTGKPIGDYEGGTTFFNNNHHRTPEGVPTAINSSRFVDVSSEKPAAQEGLSGSLRDEEADGGGDNGNDSSRTILISVLTIGVVLAISLGVFLYLRRWWRLNHSGKTDDNDHHQGPIPYCVTLLRDVFTRHSLPSTTSPPNDNPPEGEGHQGNRQMFSKGDREKYQKDRNNELWVSSNIQNGHRKKHKGVGIEPLPVNNDDDNSIAPPVPPRRRAGRAMNDQIRSYAIDITATTLTTATTTSSTTTTTTVADIHNNYPDGPETRRGHLGNKSGDRIANESGEQCQPPDPHYAKKKAGKINSDENRKQDRMVSSLGMRSYWNSARAFFSSKLASIESDKREENTSTVTKRYRLDIERGREPGRMEEPVIDEYSDGYETYVPGLKAAYDVKGRTNPAYNTSVDNCRSSHLAGRVFLADDEEEEEGEEEEASTSYGASNYEVAKLCFHSDEEMSIDQMSGYSTVDKEGKWDVCKKIVDVDKADSRLASPDYLLFKQRHAKLKRDEVKGRSEISSESVVPDNLNDNDNNSPYYKNVFMPNRTDSDLTAHVLQSDERPQEDDKVRKELTKGRLFKHTTPSEENDLSVVSKKKIKEESDLTLKSLSSKLNEEISKTDNSSELEGGTIIKVMRGDKLESIRLSPYLNPKPLATTYLDDVDVESPKYDYPDILIPNAYGNPHNNSKTRTLGFSIRNMNKSRSVSFSSSSRSGSSGTTSEDERFNNNKGTSQSEPEIYGDGFIRRKTLTREDDGGEFLSDVTTTEDGLSSTDGGNGTSLIKAPTPKPRHKSVNSTKAQTLMSCDAAGTDFYEIQFSDDECSRESFDV